ncbi:hypothetical protein [Chelativorans sp. YIM 93263]|uniref:hypothetical protein n=1 Tax=Chelativorans sp. YIM 93263 TaxID=2906648 RepID=UPI002379DB39|nr:hypothetical protein [Chelativorans sp. YIM 93263]
MRKIIFLASALSVLAAPALALEPIPGSITYGGPSEVQLEKTPVGSVTFHNVHHRGNHYREVYVVGPDQRFELVSRTLLSSD